jgi:hypothetical protein
MRLLAGISSTQSSGVLLDPVAHGMGVWKPVPEACLLLKQAVGKIIVVCWWMTMRCPVSGCSGACHCGSAGSAGREPLDPDC